MGEGWGRGVRDATRSHEDLTGGATDRAFLASDASCTTGGQTETEGWACEGERERAEERERGGGRGVRNGMRFRV